MRQDSKSNLIRDCVTLGLTALLVVLGLTYVFGSWQSGSWNPFANAKVPWGSIARVSLPATALMAAVVGATIAGHAQSARIRELSNTEDANATDRFTKALDQLASGNALVRTGSIYALERIATDSERDRKVIVQIMKSALYNGIASSNELPSTKLVAHGSLTKQEEAAVMTAILRLHKPGDPFPAASYISSGVDLSGIDFRNVHLDSCNLSNINFVESDFSGSSLRGASMRRTMAGVTNFSRTDLSGSDMTDAFFYDCNFHHATLDGADLRASELSGANFTGASLKDTKMHSHQLSEISDQLNRSQKASISIDNSPVSEKR